MSNVLITGCSSGFGLLTALRFARAGDRVGATMRTPEKAPAALTAPIAVAAEELERRAEDRFALAVRCRLFRCRRACHGSDL